MTDSSLQKPSVTKRAKNIVKAAPGKIVEHAINTAIQTVEKAADTDAKRTAKRASRTKAKLAKAKKAADIAKKEAKRASKMSSSLEKINTPQKSASTPKKIKEKIKQIISPEIEETFYYDRRQLVVLTVIYALMACFVYLISSCLVSVNMYNNAFLTAILIITQWFSLLALASAMLVAFYPQKLAVITRDTIKIDHNQPLKWQDIDTAEEKYTSYISRRPLIALHLKPGALTNYRLTIMQRLCQKNVFTPFSIPMYAMRPEDASRIRELIKKYAKYTDSRN